MEEDFKEWFDKKWKQHNGLVTLITVCKLLHLSLSRVYILRKDKKLRELKYKGDKTVYISYDDVLALAEFYKAKRTMLKRFRANRQEP